MQDVAGSGTGRNEVTPVEVWDVLRRRRRWIVASLLVFTAVAALYIALEAPIYQASAKLRIGQVAGSGRFEAAEGLSSRLLAEHGEYVAQGVRRPYPILQRAAPINQGSFIVELVAEGKQPESVVNLLEQVVGSVLAQHRQIYERDSKALNESLLALEAQRDALQREYRDASDLITRLKKDEAVQASLLTLERGQIASLIAKLDSERPDLVQKLSPPKTEPSTVLGEIVEPVRPIRPRKAMAAALALILGAIVGVSLALLAEFLSSVRTPRAGIAE